MKRTSSLLGCLFSGLKPNRTHARQLDREGWVCYVWTWGPKGLWRVLGCLETFWEEFGKEAEALRERQALSNVPLDFPSFLFSYWVILSSCFSSSWTISCFSCWVWFWLLGNIFYYREDNISPVLWTQFGFFCV